MFPESWTHEHLIKHCFAEILENQRRQMAKLEDVLAKIEKVSADFDKYVQDHQTSEAADLDQVNAALDVLDGKINPPA